MKLVLMAAYCGLFWVAYTQDVRKIEQTIKSNVQASFKEKEVDFLSFYDITLLKSRNTAKRDSIEGLLGEAVLDENFDMMLVFQEQIDSLNTVIESERKSYGVKSTFLINEDSTIKVMSVVFKITQEYTIDRQELIYSATIDDTQLDLVRKFEKSQALFDDSEEEYREFYSFFRDRLLALPRVLRGDFYHHMLNVFQDARNIESFNPTLLLYQAAVRTCKEEGVSDKGFGEPEAYYYEDNFGYYSIEVTMQDAKVVILKYDQYFMYIKNS